MPNYTFQNFNVSRHQTRLSNGIPVTLFKRPGTPIAIQAIIAAGSRFDPPNLQGTAHFLEHMLVAGTQNFPTKDKLANYIESLGGSFGASTGLDALMVDIEIGTSEDLNAAITVLTEIIVKPLFNEKTIEMERSSILKELGTKLANPSKQIWDVYKQVFFQQTPYGKSELGTKESIQAITKQNLVDFYQDMITSGGLAIVASGDTELEELVSGLEKSLIVPITSRYIFSEPISKTKEMPIMVHKYEGIDQVQLVFGFRTVPFADPKNIPLLILATILGGRRAATLTKKLRYETGLVYDVSATSSKYANAGVWEIATSTSREHVQEVLNIITQELKSVITGGITQEELQFAKDRIIKSTPRGMQTSASWIRRHGFGELVAPDEYLQLDEWLRAVESTTRQDLIETAQMFFQPDTWYLALCGNIAESDLTIAF